MNNGFEPSSFWRTVIKLEISTCLIFLCCSGQALKKKNIVSNHVTKFNQFLYSMYFYHKTLNHFKSPCSISARTVFQEEYHKPNIPWDRIPNITYVCNIDTFHWCFRAFDLLDNSLGFFHYHNFCTFSQMKELLSCNLYKLLIRVC